MFLRRSFRWRQESCRDCCWSKQDFHLLQALEAFELEDGKIGWRISRAWSGGLGTLGLKSTKQMRFLRHFEWLVGSE
jgi:hypothetical protein